jgi:DNA-binding Lrp family transcriptional regulator
MVRAFVLIDALPRRDTEVLESLGKFPQVIAKRALKERVGQADLIALLEGKDQDEIEKLITGHLRGVAGIHTIKRIMPHHTILAPVQLVMEDMYREVEQKRKAA